MIPFLVLAVGVDNMFILANALAHTDARLPLPERLGRTLANAGPSITLAASAGAGALSVCEPQGFGATLTNAGLRSSSQGPPPCHGSRVVPLSRGEATGALWTRARYWAYRHRGPIKIKALAAAMQ